MRKVKKVCLTFVLQKNKKEKKTSLNNNTSVEEKLTCFNTLNLKNNPNIVDLSKRLKNTYIFPNINSLREVGMPEDQIDILKSKLATLTFTNNSLKQLIGKDKHNLDFNDSNGKTCNECITHEFKGLPGIQRIAILSVKANDGKSRLYVFAKYLPDGLHFLPKNHVFTGNVTIDWHSDMQLKIEDQQEKTQEEKQEPQQPPVLLRGLSAYELKRVRSKNFHLNLLAAQEETNDSINSDDELDGFNDDKPENIGASSSHQSRI